MSKIGTAWQFVMLGSAYRDTNRNNRLPESGEIPCLGGTLNFWHFFAWVSLVGAAVRGELRVSGSNCNDWWARMYIYRTIASLLYDLQYSSKSDNRRWPLARIYDYMGENTE